MQMMENKEVQGWYRFWSQGTLRPNSVPTNSCVACVSSSVSWNIYLPVFRLEMLILPMRLLCRFDGRVFVKFVVWCMA